MATKSNKEVLGLEIADDLTEEQWDEIGEKFGRERNITAWQIGDWLVFAAEHYDGGGELKDTRYARAEELTGLDYGTLRNRASIARRFTVSWRRDTLSFEHHAAVKALKDNAEQDRWLDKAEKKRWSVKSLRREKSEAKPNKLLGAEDAVLQVPPLVIDFSDLRESIQRISEAQDLSMEAWCRRVLRDAVETAEQQLKVAA